MYRIVINGKSVSVDLTTIKRIEAIARDKKISIADAIAFCLERVIQPSFVPGKVI